MRIMSFRNSIDGSNRLLGWSALGAAALAMLAWAACCILPLALSIAGLSVVGTVLLAEQRTWLTISAAIVLSAAWWSVWRRRMVCASDAGCAPTSRSTLAILSTATVLFGLALIWQPLIEPWAMKLLLSDRS